MSGAKTENSPIPTMSSPSDELNNDTGLEANISAMYREIMQSNRQEAGKDSSSSSAPSSSAEMNPSSSGSSPFDSMVPNPLSSMTDTDMSSLLSGDSSIFKGFGKLSSDYNANVPGMSSSAAPGAGAEAGTAISPEMAVMLL